MSIQTPYQGSVKWVVKLDEGNGIVTVMGFNKQIATHRIHEMITTGGIQELRDKHQEYLDMREHQQAPEVPAGYAHEPYVSPNAAFHQTLTKKRRK